MTFLLKANSSLTAWVHVIQAVADEAPAAAAAAVDVAPRIFLLLVGASPSIRESVTHASHLFNREAN